jgi:hypothetical protein
MARERQQEADWLATRAFRDAMRDILASEGRFELTVDDAPEAVWDWDGHTVPRASA